MPPNESLLKAMRGLPASTPIGIPPIATTAPPPVAGIQAPPQEPTSIFMEPIVGFRNELVGALQIAKNIPYVMSQVAGLYSKQTGESVESVMKGVQDILTEAQEYVAVDPASQAPGVARQILRGVGAAPVQALEYAAALFATRRPTLAFALVDAAKAADPQFDAMTNIVEAGKAGAMGAATGFAFGKAAQIPKALPRALTSGAVGAVSAKLHGGGTEEIVASGLMGAGLGALSRPKKYEDYGINVKRDATGKPVDFRVEEPLKDLTPILSWLESPHNKFAKIPGGRDLVMKTITGLEEADDLSRNWGTRAHKAFRSIDEKARQRLIEVLDDPQYTLANPPPGSPVFRKAYTDLRSLTEEARQQIITMKRDMLPGNMSPAEKAAIFPDTWGIPEGWYPHRFAGQWTITVNGQPITFDQAIAQGLIDKHNIQAPGFVANTRAQAEALAQEFANRNKGIPPGAIKVERYEFITPTEYAKKTGKQRFYAHTQRREANLPGWAKDEQGLYDYLSGVSRYLKLAKLYPEFEAMTERVGKQMPGSALEAQWKGWVDRVSGRPDALTKRVNEWWINSIGGNANIVERGAGFVRAVETATKLSFSPGTALWNLSQTAINCVDEETQALTMNGWKFWHQLQPGDFILTYNHESDTCEWGPVNGLHHHPYEGLLFSLESGQISSRTTPGHRWSVENRISKKRSVVVNELELVSGQGKGSKHGRLGMVHAIPLARPTTNSTQKAMYPDSFVRLCGWIAAEGHYAIDGRKHRRTYGAFRKIEISQSTKENPSKCEEIAGLLEDLGWRVYSRIDRRSGVKIWGLSAEDSRKIKAVMPNKAPSPEFLTSLTHDQIRILIKAMVDGDGSRPTKNQAKFYNTSKEMMDSLQMAGAIVGLTVVVRGPRPNGYKTKKNCKPIYDARLSNGRFSRVATVSRAKRKPVQYSGVVWCPSVPTGFWVARRNGKIYCTGNTLPVLGSRWTSVGIRGAMADTAVQMQNWINRGSPGYKPKQSPYSWLLDRLHIADESTKADTLTTSEYLKYYWPRNVKESPGFWLQLVNKAGLLMFSKAEWANRATAAIGAYERSMAEAQPKIRSGQLTRDAAIEAAVRMAKEVDVRTQFIYDKVDAPSVLSNPWARTALQFQNFFVKEMEFLFGMARGKDKFGRFDTRKREVARFLGATLAVAGPLALPGVEAFDTAIEWMTGASPLEEIRKRAKIGGLSLARGIPGMLPVGTMEVTDPATGVSRQEPYGIDITRNVGFGDIFDLSRLPKGGPIVQELQLAWNAATAPPGREQAQAVKALVNRMSPMGRRIWESFASDAAARGEIRDVQGRIVAEDLTALDRWLNLGGITTVKLAEQKEDYIRAYEKVRRARSVREGYIDAIVDAIRTDKYDLVQKLVEDANAEGPEVGRGTSAAARRRLKETSQTRLESLQKRYRRILPKTETGAAVPVTRAVGAPVSGSGQVNQELLKKFRGVAR